jgi:hypothetical protein
LHRLFSRRFKDRRLLGLFSTLLASYSTAPGKGLPIGSLTSQHFANLYLAPFDHFVKETLRVPGYVRYMDDFVLFDADRERLRRARDAVAAFLGDELRLHLKHPGLLDRTAAGLPFLGLSVRPSHVRLLAKTKRRVRRKLRALVGAHGRAEIDAAALAVRATALLVRTTQVKARGLRTRWLAEFAAVDA